MVRRRRHRRFPALLAAGLFCALAVLPWISPTSTTPPWVAAARSVSSVPLPSAPVSLPAISLTSTARPVAPQDPPASRPSANNNHQAALVVAEDNRVRSLLHDAARLTAPTLLDVPGSLATLILPARLAPYSFSDLQSDGAVTQLDLPGWYVLTDSILVAPSATLDIRGGVASTLLLDSTASGFTSLVEWGGTLDISGTAQEPLNIMGWDSVNSQPATDAGYGRPYIRGIGGQLELSEVRASNLGFWSGRTGGVAWTGISTQPSSGYAVDSTFTGDTYGAFVTGASDVNFSDDLFESNELDGLRLNRNTSYASVTASTAARNGGNGFVVSRGASNDTLLGDEAIHNAGNGFLLDGQPLVSGASPSGGQIDPSSGSVVKGGDSANNGLSGILVEGGVGTVVQDNLVCGASTGIAVRLGASGTSVVGNDVGCGSGVALEIGPSVIGTTVSGNVLSQANIGILIRNSPGVRIMNNQISTITVFAISVRGTSPGVVGNDNVVAGRGFDPINTQSGASTPILLDTISTGWQRKSNPTVISYLRYHPLLTVWLSILTIVVVCWIAVRLRRRPRLPYRHVVPWQPRGAEAGAAALTAAPAAPEHELIGSGWHTFHV